MHGYVPYDEFLQGISPFLGGYYLAIALMNGIAAFYLWEKLHAPRAAAVWSGFALLMMVLAAFAMGGIPPALPDGLKRLLDGLMGPTVYSLGIVVVLGIAYYFRLFFVQPTVAWAIFNLSLVFMGFSMVDQNFAAIVTKPDNVPIVGMVYLLGFFTWLGGYKAVVNDDRLARGLEPMEKLDNEKVLVWPDLVYTEMICMVAITAFLLIWGIALEAPLEEPASAVKTPNPSKAPWYFLGLQEMLVYYDPWMAGVVLPSLIVFGLMAIPFLDFNKKGNGYYTINERKFAYVTFQFGFLVLWVTLIVMGTFLRGPNWSFFGFYETWDAHKVEAMNNVNLSEIFWFDLLRTGMPTASEGAGLAGQLGAILLREAPGLILVVLYFTVIPPALVVYSKFFRQMYLRMGFIRYMVLANLLLFMALLPIKMFARWTVSLKYFVAIPEYFLNF